MSQARFPLQTAIAILVMHLLCSGTLPAQFVFERTYGGASNDMGASAQQTSDGGYVIAGWTGSIDAGGADVYLIKINSRGDTLWTRTYGGLDNDIGNSVQQTSDGGYVLTGWTTSFGPDGDVYLIRTDSLGDTLWTRTYGGALGDEGISVQETSDEGYIIAGNANIIDMNVITVMYLIKTNSLGDTLWSRTYARCALFAGCGSVQQTSDGGYIIAGTASSLGAGVGNACLVKTNSRGDTLWTRTFGGASFAAGSSVQQTSDGGYVLTGWTTSIGTGTLGVYLIKTNSLGDTLWTRTYGGASFNSYGHSVQQTSDGGYIIVGSIGIGGRDVYLVRIDSLGETLWTRTYGGAGYEDGNSVQLTSDGGYIIAGTTFSFGAGEADVYLIKADINGLITSVPDIQSAGIPSECVLKQNYPNPFNPSTTIKYELPKSSMVNLSVYDMLGREVSVLVNERRDAGVHEVKFDGSGLSSGVYLYRLRAGEFVQTRKLLLLQ